MRSFPVPFFRGRAREGGELGWSLQGNRDDFTDIAGSGRGYCHLFVERAEFESRKDTGYKRYL